MCKAFSCLVTKRNKVYWQAGMDSHSGVQAKFVKEDKQLNDNKLPPNNTFARIEIVPNNNNYLKPDKWIYKIDENIAPFWLSKRHENSCMKAFKKWEKQVYLGINMKEALNPIHPFRIKPPKIEKKHLKLLLHWESVRASVEESVWASVWASVRASVEESVWDSVWASLRASVGDSVRASVWESVEESVWDSLWDSVGDSLKAYQGSLFTNIKKWKYCNFKYKGYPFKDAVKLWKMGLVASYSTSDKKWRLHGGKKAKILWEGTLEELKQQSK